MNILFITDPYPTLKNPSKGIFVYNFVQELIKLGHKVTVISPSRLSPTDILKKNTSYGTEEATVYSPTIITASARKIGRFHTYSISRRQKVKAVQKIVKKNNLQFDIVYCHFIQSALFAIEALKEYNKPFFVAVGENNSLKITKKWYNEKDYNDLLSYVNGYIAVSDVVKQKLMALNKINSDKIFVARNGTDLSRFNTISKLEARKELGFQPDDFLVVFIGRFVESKGPLRLVEATKSTNDIKLAMVGSGPQKFESENIVFCKSVPKDVIPVILSAGDVFVLPTLHEGSNNAIVEAMASGLPIISSDIPEVREQVNEELAVLVDPLSIDQIREAILSLKNDKIRLNVMSEASLKNSKNFDIKLRAKRIINFINEQMINQ